ncbi:MAG: TIR domain-containing protein [Cyanobacteriota bacterium]
MRVFLSHSSRDKPAVEALARFLRQRGIDAWFDQWEIAPGDDILAKINAGLEQADAGLIVFSAQSLRSPWVNAEVSALTHERIQKGQPLIPVQVGDDAYVPPLLRPLCRLSIDDHRAIADALLNRRAGPPPLGQPGAGREERVCLRLERGAGGSVALRATFAGLGSFEAVHGELPLAVRKGRLAFLKGFGSGARDRSVAGSAVIEAELLALGQALGAFCLPEGAEEVLARLLDGAEVGTTVLVEIEAEDPELLGLPFEAMRLPDGRLLAIQPAVLMRRRLPAPATPPPPPLAGPLKVLVAVGAPDEGARAATVLDHEREMQNILDAVEPAQRRDNVEVKILEVGHPDQIAAAIETDAYHVLHLSCHGRPGSLELEDEDGQAVPVTAAELVAPIRALGRPLPLVVLNACHGGVEAGIGASLAQALIQAGIPGVVAMQTTVSDRYATELARAFYGHLCRIEPVLASRALALARQELEAERRRRLNQGAPLAANLPEAATTALYCAGEERPLANFGLDKQPLRDPPMRQLAGPVPQLAIGDLVGRRREIRACLRRLRDPGCPGGVLLSGIGGVGKSGVAGRVMGRLAEDGWVVASHSGRFDPRAIGLEVGLALMETGRQGSRPLADSLLRQDLDDQLRFRLLERLLAQEPLLLVLDDFEQNLSPGGEAFLDRDTGGYLVRLLAAAQRGRLLLTCRHPLPASGSAVWEVPLGPLSDAETRKLVQRLPGLRQLSAPDLGAALRTIGGHPRLLEFLDGLLREGQGRLPAVTRRLGQALASAGLSLGTSTAGLEERLRQTVVLGMRDVLLEELLGIVRQRGDEEVLAQLAVSNLPLAPEGLARMLAKQGEGAAVTCALDRLAALSLVVRAVDGQAWVHRWTAEGLAALCEPPAHAERCRRAGDYRIWRVGHESHALEDGIEAMRNYQRGEHFDQAVAAGQGCLEALARFGQTMAVASLAAELLETLPSHHSGFAVIADAEARAHLALGFTDQALDRYRQLLAGQERLSKAEPERADYQRDLSVSYERMGDLYVALGRGEEARQAYQGSLEIRERLSKAEPERADYQRDLVISLVKIGTVADPVDRAMLQSALAILESLERQGRLAPADQPKIAAIHEMLAG